uniref:PH domain-containing protein n=1 Tax=Rhizochromulina marina TaxID=1034831 RepID=A0A7S2RUH6_9STRA
MAEEQKPDEDLSSPIAAARHRLLDKAIRAFNLNPKKGIQVLKESGLITPGEPESLATFFLRTAGINKAKLGEWMGDSPTVNTEVMQRFVEGLPLVGCTIVDGLRHLLARFELPTEQRKVHRIAVAYSHIFHIRNAGDYSSSDTVRRLTIEILAFNANLLETSVDRKTARMGLEEFVEKCRGIDKGHDLGREELETMFQELVDNPIITIREREDEGNLFTAPIKEGWMKKQGGHHKAWKKRWFILCNSTLYYFKDENDIDPKGFFPLENVEASLGLTNPKQIVLVPTGRDLLKSAKFDTTGAMVTGNHKTLLLLTPSEQEALDWLHALNQSAVRSAISHYDYQTSVNFEISAT